jgi:hypothetical protein
MLDEYLRVLVDKVAHDIAQQRGAVVPTILSPSE